MSYPLYRRGAFALLDGSSYPISYTVGEDYVYFSDGEPRSVDKCERVFSVQVYATYRDHKVLVDDVDITGMARVMEAEWDAGWATENGFVHESANEYFKTVDLRDLRNYYEKQNDLLFARWRATHFVRFVEEHPGESDWIDSASAVFDGRPRSGVLSTEDGRMAAVTTRAEYLGYPCEIAGIAADGSVGIYSLGADESRAEADGFTLAKNGRWMKAVHIYDLARYHEHHADLLFDQWRESTVY
ncbi:MAG TPA: hypothetical protein VJT49_24170 [Amycolatopsis sp.]|uniref:hypothetical protein n=1 Tax=Amycolatopsis sp. TaxID=37632 RepID=UPI002B494803|nr:hypothetical protein [Amycolatopsis sp.]HKS48148.1 hypothetical protein [Amycolatopsis sp.]